MTAERHKITGPEAAVIAALLAFIIAWVAGGIWFWGRSFDKSEEEVDWLVGAFVLATIAMPPMWAAKVVNTMIGVEE